jgi:hypothetical protein
LNDAAQKRQLMMPVNDNLGPTRLATLYDAEQDCVHIAMSRLLFTASCDKAREIADDLGDKAGPSEEDTACFERNIEVLIKHGFDTPELLEPFFKRGSSPRW